ncbi:2-hydroxyacid dehydrogenase [Nocardioides caldifontis]|uniref:2-hydroxyacid dehydrogenase n=1 Tax=Nocardioides caldifontis TaxID=2588938 RepID=UPI001EF12D63|nr:2-hydroxyacid dehydrogenase [Nocardioides caldifontis]
MLSSLAERLDTTYGAVELPTDDDVSEALATHGPGARVLVVSYGHPVGRPFLEALPDLEAVVNFGVGYDNIDVAAAHERGIVVGNTPDVLNDSVAELTVGLLLDVLRRMSAGDRYVRAGRWESGVAFPLARQLAGRRVGIVGMGRIGAAVARRLEPFGCEIGYHNRREVDASPYRFFDSALALAETSDALVVLAPATPETRHLVDADVLSALGPDGVLVNVARGSLVDECALLEALRAGTIAGAGLDVYADEPRVPSELWERDDVVLLPHVGSATREAREAMAGLVLDNVEAFLASGSLVTPVEG